MKTDGHVLAIMRKKWHSTFAVAHLWWLNTMPGAGGRPFRGKKHNIAEAE